MNSRVVSSDVDTSPDAMLAYELAKTIHRSGGNPTGVFGMLDRLVRERSWTRLCNAAGEPFGSFTELVEAPEPFGLGTTRVQLRVLLKLRHPREDSDPEWRERAPELRRIVEQLLDEDIPAANSPGNPHDVNVSGTQDKRDSAATVSRLKRDDPVLAERVVSGEVTANAAAREKGWRKPRVLLANPNTVARRIRESFTDDQIAAVVALLVQNDDTG